MRCTDEETSDLGCKKNSTGWPSKRTLAVSVNSPLSNLLKSATTKDDLSSSDFSRSGSGEGFIYAYNCKTSVQKAKSLKKSLGTPTTAASLARSQEPATPGFSNYGITRSRTMSTVTSDFTNTLNLSEKSKCNRPKVLKYVQNFSSCFESISLLKTEFEDTGDVKYYKALHELDGQTYVLKKRRIYIGSCQEIQDHPAYEEIRRVKDNSATLNIHYVNSWVEMDSNCQCESNDRTDNGLFVILCIQMRYVKDFVKLARDLLILSGPSKDLDEDTLDDMSEDTYDEAEELSTQGVSLKDAIIRSFTKIGYSASTTPSGLEEETWRICFDDALLLH